MLENFRFRSVHKPHLGLCTKLQHGKGFCFILKDFLNPWTVSAQIPLHRCLSPRQLASAASSFFVVLSLSLSLSHTHTHTHINILKEELFWILEHLREFLKAPCQVISHCQDEGKGGGMGKEKPSLQKEWRWKHCKANSCKFHKCHSPSTKTVFRQHNNPLRHLFCLRDYYSTILPFHLPRHSMISLIVILCLSQVFGVRLIQMMTWRNWREGCWQPEKPCEDSPAFSIPTQLQVTAF